jgi:transcriptional regulator with XRE-family HTH domain
MTGEKENDIGYRIKQVRLELKLKQQEFAEKLDISGPSLSEIETGKTNPGIDLLVRLHKDFNVNLYYVLFGEGSMFEDPLMSDLRKLERYAVNLEDVREFLYNFKRSSIIQYFILNQYKKQMVLDEEAILKELGEYKEKPGE